MEGTIGEIRLFAPNFAPKNWALCQGQLLSIAQNQALFSILGTTYGGDGRTTFALPDFRGRTAVSSGQSQGTSNYLLGEMVGTENVTLLLPNLPSHSHAVTITNQSGTIAIHASNDEASLTSPVNNYPAIVNGFSVYKSNPDSTLKASPVNVGGSLSATVTGGTQPHENRQPFLALNYIICQYGIFPSRN